MRVAKAFKKLNENTALYFAKQRKTKINHYGSVISKRLSLVEVMQVD